MSRSGRPLSRARSTQTPPGIDYTGERIVPDLPKCGSETDIYQTHLARYRFASRYGAGKVVLDIACGVGYGSRFLADHGAAQVIGGDISPDAIRYARERYESAQTRFEVMSADDLPLDDSSVDCVVSMETIEHLPDADRFVSEIDRVLRPGGTTIVSTPNRATYGAGQPAPDNRFHTTEYTLEEFIALLEPHFEALSLFAQRRLIRRSRAGRRLDATARGLRDRLGLRAVVPARLSRLARRAADAYDRDPRVVPLAPGDEPLFFVALCRARG